MIISHASAAGGPPSPCSSIYIRLHPQEPTKSPGVALAASPLIPLMHNTGCANAGSDVHDAMFPVLRCQLVGFPKLGVQTWGSYVHVAMFPRVCVNSWESFTLVSVLPFPGLLVDSQECVVPGIARMGWTAMSEFLGICTRIPVNGVFLIKRI